MKDIYVDGKKVTRSGQKSVNVVILRTSIIFISRAFFSSINFEILVVKCTISKGEAFFCFLLDKYKRIKKVFVALMHRDKMTAYYNHSQG